MSRSVRIAAAAADQAREASESDDTMIFPSEDADDAGDRDQPMPIGRT
jgi:hypothetical protein